MGSPSDESLLQAFTSGDAASFELLVRRHAREAHQFAQRMTGNAATADDVVQEAFWSVHQHAKSFHRSRRFKPWLFAIVANRSRDYLRRRDHRHEISLETQVDGLEEAGAGFIDILSEDGLGPLDTMGADERRRLVRRVVASMPEHLRELLILSYFHRFPYKEIAEILGIPTGRVKSRLHAAIVEFGKRYRTESLSANDETNREA